MIRLLRTHDALGTPHVAAVLKPELEALPASLLPLQALLRQTAYALDEFQITVLAVEENPACARFRVGVFCYGVNPGCSCADDPSPVTPVPEYGELEVELDRHSAEARIMPV